MALELTELFQQALDAYPGEPLRVTDPRTQETYVLVREEMFRRLGELSYDDSEFPIREAYPLMDAVATQEGWADPEMDSYNGPARGKQP